MKAVFGLLASLGCGILSTSAVAQDASSTPIDTSISVRQGNDAKGGKAHAPKKSKFDLGMGKDSKPPAANRQPDPVLQRNTIGVKLDPPKTADLGTAAAAHLAATSAGTASTSATTTSAGTSPQPAVSAPGSDPAGKKAVTGTVPSHPSPGATALSVVAGNGPSINGTGLARQGTGTGMVGGSPKISGGTISGNNVHLRHP